VKRDVRSEGPRDQKHGGFTRKIIKGGSEPEHRLGNAEGRANELSKRRRAASKPARSEKKGENIGYGPR